MQSAGCHELIREWGAVCVTSASDVLEHVSPLGEEHPARWYLGRTWMRLRRRY